MRIEYKGFIINSNPHRLFDGKFSTNGTIEQHSGSQVVDHVVADLQAATFDTEEEAKNWFIQESKKIIDKKS